jgi:nucleoid DNA-binding protein
LKPKKIKDLIPQLAKELGLSEKEVASVLGVYWDKVRKTLSSLDHNRLYLKGLGTFYVKPWAVNKKMEINDRIVNKYTQTPTPKSLSIINQVISDNLKLQRVKEREEDGLKIKIKKRNERRNQNLEGEG